MVALLLTNNQKKKNEEISNTSNCEIMAFAAQFNYGVLSLLNSNKIEKATKMLETSVFLNLEQIWQTKGEDFIESNTACNETFKSIYPNIRLIVGEDHFKNFLPQDRSKIIYFMTNMDSVYLKDISH
jgi:hypothetical protein